MYTYTHMRAHTHTHTHTQAKDYAEERKKMLDECVSLTSEYMSFLAEEP